MTSSDDDANAPSRVLDRLRAEAPRGARYRVLGEVARGGMGAILEIWDVDLRRTLAMKVALDGAGSGADSQASKKVLDRFLEEAQVTGQLDHPGIVPVHELGLGADGRVYFTMKLVKGDDLGRIFARVWSGVDGWTQVRALGVMLRVCEAMSYAHSKQVIHRDLKPANVMVGKFGEVYVMDWGLARVLGREDTHDLRIAPRHGADIAPVFTERREERGGTADSPLLTMDGDVVGTPSFMSPEQARGQLAELGPHSDVYAVGAMLYQLLADRMPYATAARTSQYEILLALLEGPPQPLSVLAPKTPPELIAIVEKAMARDLAARYPTMQELADDLRAFIEGRVVRAYEAGALAEAKKWVKRNRSLAAALAGGVVILIAGGVTSLVYASLAVKRSNDVLSLSAAKDLEEILARADKLWPATPAMIPELERWLADARSLIEGSAADPALGTAGRRSLEQHRATLAELRSRAKPLAAGAARAEGEAAWQFDDLQDRWWHVQLSRLVADLERLCDPAAGCMGDALAEPFGWGVRRRIDFAQSIRERTLDGPEARRRWSDALSAIEESGRYPGLRLAPQLGLLPIGVDPRSGLFEFWHVQTGDEPLRDGDGKLLPNERTGLVFVLLPGGDFVMGAQKTDPAAANHELDAGKNELAHPVRLSPYFISKYEMTQGQWLRIAGGNPSEHRPGTRAGKHPHDLRHPVEQVNWHDCRRVLAWLDLALPSEAQWEYAARGGTSTAWWTGAERESLRGRGNFADQTAKRLSATWPEIGDWPDLDDGWIWHAPVGTFEANPFGLHEVHGNVWEWCLDAYESEFYKRGGGLDPVADAPDAKERVLRGGGFDGAAMRARSANRRRDPPEYLYDMVGVRPARRIEDP